MNHLLNDRLVALGGAEGSHLRERREHLLSTAAIDAENAWASLSRLDSRKAAEETVKTRIGWAEEALSALHPTERAGSKAESDVAEGRAALKRERELTNRVHAEVDPIQQRRHDSEALVAAVDRFLGTATRKGEDGLPSAVELATTKLPEGDRAEIVATQRAEIARFIGELEDLPTIPPRLETEKRHIRAQVAELAKKGQPGVALVDMYGPDPVTGEHLLLGSTAKVHWPRKDIGAAPAHSKSETVPRVVDAAALVAWLFPERLTEVLEADLERAYVGVDEQLDPHERTRRKRDLKAAILKAERLECAAIWALIEAGDETVRFRPDTDPRAVLGIA